MKRFQLALLLTLGLISFVSADYCAYTFRSCGSCTSGYDSTTNSRCVWCPSEGTCASQNTGCGSQYYWSLPSQCPNNVPVSVPVSTDLCSRYYSCSSCNAQSVCGWCSSTNTCHRGTAMGPTPGYCSTSAWRWLSCSAPASPIAQRPSLAIFWIFLGVGAALCVVVLIIALLIRRRRLRQQAQSADVIELAATSAVSDDSAPGYTYAPAPAAFAEAVPGYLYTTPTAGNQPQYIYTAVPVGAPVQSL